MKRLAFVEAAADLALVPAGYDVISAHPRVTVACEESGVAYSRPEDYVADEAIESLGLENYARVETLCAALDTATAPFFGDDVQGGTWSFRSLKIFFDAISMRAHYIERILDVERPEALLVFAGSGSGPPTPFPPDAPLYAPVVAAAARHRLLGLEVKRSSADDRGVRTRSPWRTRASELRTRVSVPRHRATGVRVLCSDYAYGVPAIAAELEAAGVDVFRLPVRRRPRLADPAALWRAIAESQSVRSHFSWNGLDLWEAAAIRFRHVVEYQLTVAGVRYREAETLLRRTRPDVVLMSKAVHPFEIALVAAARQLGILTVVSRHGGVGMRRMSMARYDDQVDVALCWGEWEAESVRHHSGGAVTAIVTGSPLTETLAASAPSRAEVRARLGIPAGEDVVLYIPTSLAGSLWFAGKRAPSDGEYFEQQRRILGALAALGCTVVVKHHHVEEDPAPLERWARRALGLSIRFLRSPPYGELLHLAEAVVIDAPFTTLVEGVFGSSHLYVVDHPVIDWSPGVVDHLERHGIVVCATEALGARMADDRRRGLWRTEASYGPEAREPLAAGGEGSAAARAAAAILGLVDR